MNDSKHFDDCEHDWRQWGDKLRCTNCGCFKPADAVNHPPHYTKSGIECIDAIEAATASLQGFEGYCAGNALKYLWRHEFKNGTEDLQKAVWYIDRLVATRKKRGAK